LSPTAQRMKPANATSLRQHVIDALEELKAKDIREIDVRGKTSIADLLVIASGTSARHVKSIADEVVRFAKKAGVMPIGVEGEQEAEWVLVDLGDVIVHVMLPAHPRILWLGKAVDRGRSRHRQRSHQRSLTAPAFSARYRNGGADALFSPRYDSCAHV